LIFNQKYTGIVKTWEIVQNIGISKAFFILLFVYHFLSETGFNLASGNFMTLGHCWTVRTAKTFKVLRDILTFLLL